MAKEKEKPAPEEGQEGKKKPPMLIIIAAVAVIVLGGGGFFAWKMLKGHPAEEAHPKAEVVEQKVICDWDPFLVNLADPGGKRYLKINMKTEMSNAKVLEEVKNRNFELRDAILMILSSKEFDDIATASGKSTLKHEILTQLNKVVKQGQVTEIYFIEFIVQ